MVYDETPPCSPNGDEGLEGLLSCNIFEAKLFEEDYYEHEEASTLQEHEAFDEDSLIFDKDVADNYWSFMENPIYDMSREGSVDSKSFGVFIENPTYHISTEGSVHLETLGNPDIREAHSEFAYDHSEPYYLELHTSISNEDLVKQCSEESDIMHQF